MPKVSIREIDNTGSEALEYLDYTVLVPGLILKDAAGVEYGGLYTKAEDFKKDLAECAGVEYDDKAIIMTYEYLKKGLSVYYVGVYEYEVSGDLVRRKNGTSSIDKIQILKVEDLYEDFYVLFTDKGKYDFRFITTGGIADRYAEEACKAALKCAGERGDAVAILSAPVWEYRSDESGAPLEPIALDSSVKIDEWVNNKLGLLCRQDIERPGVSWKTTDQKETYGRYAAIFSPACKYKLVKMSGESADVLLPASFMYLTNFAKYISNYACWYAMAGSVRGVSAYAPVYPAILFGDRDIDLFQVRSGDDNLNHIATNAVCEIRPYGNIVWGNRTMHPLSKPEGDSEAAIQLVASSFLNIRQLCCAIKKQLYRSARRFTFEPNSDVLWINFKKSIEPLLNEMKANQGIRGYQIIKVKTDKKALLVARIQISPIEAVEDFDLTVELNDSIDVAE